jgi:hypothetical protein
MVRQATAAWPPPNAKGAHDDQGREYDRNGLRELTLEELEIVSGGLNPQPLPPRWGEPGIRFLNPQPLPPG